MIFEIIIQVLQVIIAVLCICALYYIIKDLRHSDDEFIVHEIDFEDLSKEEQEALLKFMDGMIEDD